VVVHAELDQKHCESIEDKIESQYEELRFAEEDPRNERMKKFKEEMGLDPNCKLAMLKKTQSIGCYFVVSCEERLMQLRGHFVSGVMKNVLEKIFTLLANTDIVISHLRWDSKEYLQSMQQLLNSKARGQCIINNVLNIIVLSSHHMLNLSP
jgi:hypothetical protein